MKSHDKKDRSRPGGIPRESEYLAKLIFGNLSSFIPKSKCMQRVHKAQSHHRVLMTSNLLFQFLSA